MFSAELAAVTRRLHSYPAVKIYPGRFPQTAAGLSAARFSFVHLDVDVYQSTRDALEYFYPRLTAQGALLAHDYASAAGVKKAFDDFFQDKPEPIIRLPMSQCLIIKQPAGT
jgi:hypothetical protein